MELWDTFGGKLYTHIWWLNLLKNTFFSFFKFLGQIWLLWCLFEIWTHSKSSLWKDIFKRENLLSERHFLIKFWSKIVFGKDDFEKYTFFCQKVSLEKKILRNIKILVKKCLSKRRFSHLKVSFTKTILKRVHISKKHHKSHVWSKN